MRASTASKVSPSLSSPASAKSSASERIAFIAFSSEASPRPTRCTGYPANANCNVIAWPMVPVPTFAIVLISSTVSITETPSFRRFVWRWCTHEQHRALCVCSHSMPISLREHLLNISRIRLVQIPISAQKRGAATPKCSSTTLKCSCRYAAVAHPQRNR